jgi:hypothetical protein
MGPHQVGRKFKVNKVRLKFNAVSILVGQYFIMNTWLLSINVYWTHIKHKQYSSAYIYIYLQHKAQNHLNQNIINMKLNHLSAIEHDLFLSSSSIIMWGSRLLLTMSMTNILVYTLRRWHNFTHESWFPSRPDLQVLYSLPRWVARVSLRSFPLESSLCECWKWPLHRVIWHNLTLYPVYRVKHWNYAHIQSKWDGI